VSNFFYDALGRTYQDCYTDFEPNVCTTAAPNPVNVAVALGSLEGNATETPTRTVAIVANGRHEGAYLFAASIPDAVPIYCLGRGTLEGDNCVIDTCGRATEHYVTVGPPTGDGGVCYHTCFRE